MLRVVQEALADIEGATYEVREVSVVRDEYGESDNYAWGPLPLNCKVFAAVQHVDCPSDDELSDNDFERERQLERYYQPEAECDDVIPLITTPLPNVTTKNGPFQYEATDWMNVQLEKVTAEYQQVDEAATVVSMKGWGFPRNLTCVGQYWGNGPTFQIDWYRQAALIVTLPQ